ncbi:MAG TPA: PIN domain-containing protein [Thermoanaerobaculia bacterium]|nr:PIN domain-containing protein [Thermoanaerobaculia bacterium]
MSSEAPRKQPPLFGVDTMVAIYHFEDHEELGPPASALLQATEDGRCGLVLSILARLEALVVPRRHGREDLCRRYREVFEAFPNLEVVPVEARVAEIASDLRAAHNLRTPDAIHLATALHRGADAFVTEDRRHYPAEVRGLPVLSIHRALERLPEE